MRLLLFLLIVCVSGCIHNIPNDDLYEIVDKKENGDKYFKFKKVQPKNLDEDLNILNSFGFNNAILLKAIVREGGDLFIFARELNWYNNQLNPTTEGFVQYLKNGFWSSVREDVIDSWWKKVMMSYDLLLKIEKNTNEKIK